MQRAAKDCTKIFQHSTARSAPQTAQPVPLRSQFAEASLDMLGTWADFQRIFSGGQKPSGRRCADPIALAANSTNPEPHLFNFFLPFPSFPFFPQSIQAAVQLALGPAQRVR